MMNSLFLKIKHFLINKIRVELGTIFSNRLVVEHYKHLVYDSNSCVPSDKCDTDIKICVSLTTYSKRIYDVALVIESIMRQTLRPNKIVLWLDKDEFTKDNLPYVLFPLINRGLEVRYCLNMRSYKKIIPTLQLYPDYNIITIDDDIIYPLEFIENFVRSYKASSHCIYYYRGRFISKTRKNVYKPAHLHNPVFRPKSW